MTARTPYLPPIRKDPHEWVECPLCFDDGRRDEMEERLREWLTAAREQGAREALDIVMAHVLPIGQHLDYSRGFEMARASIEREIRAALRIATPGNESGNESPGEPR